MKKLLLFTAAILCCVFTNAQSLQTIKGTVVDSARNQPLGYATIALQTVQAGKPVKSMLSKDNGSFEFTGLALKGYKLIIATVGFKNRTILIDSTKTSIDLGQIQMAVSTKSLNEVSVTALKPIMKQEVDRISYDVQADPESKAITALDMMRKVPMLSVDGNENIKLKGSGAYKILINGKESALMAKNPSDVLKAMPATNIEKIEVITTPPAKYDAEGLAGIINIITKKNADQGYNGTISGRMNSIYGPGINFNGTVKQGKFGVSGYLGSNRQFKQTTASGGTQNFFANNTTINQNGTNTFGGGFNNYGDAELSYEIDSLNLLTASFEYYGGNFNQSSTQLSSQLTGANVLTQQFFLDNNGSGRYQGLDAGINYQLGFKNKKDRLLTISYKYGNSPFKQSNNILLSQQINYNLPNYTQYNEAGNISHTFQLDYANPIKKGSIEAGAKAILRNNFSDSKSDNQDPVTGQYIPNPVQTNYFTYHQNVYSAYSSYQLKMTNWTAKAGLRLEETHVDANFTTLGSALDRNYANLIPSVSLQRNLKSSSLTAGFTQRIQRPGIWQLNPFIDRSNPKFISTGNPDLRPELNNTFELTYSNFKKGSVNVTASYAFSNNAIQNVSSSQAGIINGQPDIITTTTYQNLGSNRSAGLNFSTNQSIGKKITINLNGQLSHVWLRGTYNSAFYTNDGTIGNAFLNAGYKFANNYRFGIDAGYFSGDVTLQGHSTAFIYNSFVLTKEFMDKKASISLVANNPYSKYFTFKNYTNTVDYTQYSFNENPYRTFALRFSYKFGKLNGDIKRNQHGINNDDTKGGGKSNGN
ncbi:outer membrane beta-barrel family protein [Mucilaginibacter ginkgonis]|uniref:TonB-dependent receptor n=1 Tax=Mucilaginibacter ginkgonis TaxID=2682091 RepID=A0A6I4INP3_9SPHI|nr:outer membrane beta-barrel family protein [Mucilaginibacter ginkgonis]QQL48625.1 TonB-dependent receptor [Mucilaginibacter ginkgonis]